MEISLRLVYRDTMKTLAENLRAFRRLRGLTQDQLAVRAGVSQTTIDKIEQGRTLKSKFLPNIAVALSVPLEKLDPAVAEAMEQFSENKKLFPESFYTLKPPESWPLYGIDRENDNDYFSISKEPILTIPAPRMFIGINVQCILWDNDLLSPIIDAGDSLFFNIDGTTYAGKTGLFFSSGHNNRRYMLAKLVMADEKKWTVKTYNNDKIYELPLEEWPICAPLKVRYCYDLGDSIRNRGSFAFL